RLRPLRHADARGALRAGRNLAPLSHHRVVVSVARPRRPAGCRHRTEERRMSEHIKVSDSNGVRSIVMARPAKKNAITGVMDSATADAVIAAQSDPSVRVVVFAAEGSAFTAGNDIVDFLQNPPRSDETELPPVLRFIEAILSAEKPLAAAVNGVAVGI